MPAKRKRKKPPKPISAKQRAADDELREKIKRIDLDQFDKLLEKAIHPSK